MFEFVENKFEIASLRLMKEMFAKLHSLTQYN